jgi:hypothetical protein
MERVEKMHTSIHIKSIRKTEERKWGRKIQEMENKKEKTLLFST